MMTMAAGQEVEEEEEPLPSSSSAPQTQQGRGEEETHSLLPPVGFWTFMAPVFAYLLLNELWNHLRGL